MKINVILVLVAGLFSFTTATNAATYDISQKNIAFSQPILKISPGDSVQFINNDVVTHNIVSVTPEFAFDLGNFKPGKKETRKFPKEGEIDIECAIHPNMKMTLFVFETWRQKINKFGK